MPKPIEALIERWQANLDSLPQAHPYRQTLQFQLTALKAAYAVENDERAQMCADCKLTEPAKVIELTKELEAAREAIARTERIYTSF